MALIAIACALGACEYRHETTVQPTPTTAAVVTPAPTAVVTPVPSSTVVTTPAPATSTTVYTR
jgi:hypothetical protein